MLYVKLPVFPAMLKFTVGHSPSVTHKGVVADPATTSTHALPNWSLGQDTVEVELAGEQAGEPETLLSVTDPRGDNREGHGAAGHRNAVCIRKLHVGRTDVLARNSLSAAEREHVVNRRRRLPAP